MGGKRQGRLRRLLDRDRRPAAEATAADPLAQLSENDARIVSQALPYTMTGVPRLQATIDAVRYCVDREIEGAFAECGVWRGGSVLAMILTLQQLDVTDRDVYLYDTFEGMTAPSAADVSSLDPPALETWNEAQSTGTKPWSEMFSSDVFDESDVRRTVTSTGYPEERIHFVRGPVEETLPAHSPPAIAALRLDTDWYESTLHELQHLYPVLAAGGVLIIDDYGHWDGARKAVDEYFHSEAPPILLNRIDYTGRIGIKG